MYFQFIFAKNIVFIEVWFKRCLFKRTNPISISHFMPHIILCLLERLMLTWVEHNADQRLMLQFIFYIINPAGCVSFEKTIKNALVI